MKINLEALYQCLNLRYVPSTDTIVKGVQNEPVTLLQEPYVAPKQGVSTIKIKEAVRSEIYKTVDASLNEIPDNKKIGVFISGGIDSTTVLNCLTNLTDRNIQTFTMGFGEDTDEFDDAKRVSEHYGTTHRELLVEDVLKDFSQLIDIIGMPKRTLWGYYLAKFASQHVDVIFDGLGGDELFAGYTFRYADALKQPHETATQKAMAYTKYAHPRDFIERCSMFGERFKGCTVDDVTTPFKKVFQNDLPYMEQLLIADLNIKCAYDFMPLFKLDEAAGLDAKVPLLSPDLIKFAFTIPHDLKYNYGNGKYIMKKAFSDEIPDFVINKEKQGFGCNPAVVWDRTLKDYVESTLLEGATVEDGYINKKYVKDILSRDTSETLIPHYNKLWDALAFEIWYSSHMDVV